MSTRLMCTFSIADGRYAVPVDDVQEVIRQQELTPVPLAHPTVVGLINLRGQIVTAIDLRRRLDMPARPAGRPDPMNVVVRTADGPKALLVDEIGDVIEVCDDTREPPPDTLSGRVRDSVCGVYKLRDYLLLVLDTEHAVRVP